MLKRLIIMLIWSSVSCYTLFAEAATCPAVTTFNPYSPPAGWSLLMPPVVNETEYYFSVAIHYLDSSVLYPQRILCLYRSCSGAFCPAFSLLSNVTYVEPAQPSSQWQHHYQLQNALICIPAQHDPADCEFGDVSVSRQNG